MSDYEINIKPGSVSVRTGEPLYDKDGNVVEYRNHRKAFSLGNVNGDVVEFQNRVNAMLHDVFGTDLAQLVASQATVIAERDGLKIELEAIKLERDKLKSKQPNEVPPNVN